MNTTLKKFLSNYWILLLLVAIKFILQYHVVNPVYELHRDEFLHLDQAKHLAFGFISVPPFTSLVSKVILLLGGGIFWVRFFPALFGALTIVFAWLIAETLGGKLWAKLLSSCAVLFSVLLRLNILYQPNAFDILSWTLLIYLLINYFKTQHPNWLYGFAVMAAAGILNKYTLVFLLLGLLAGIVLTPERKLISKAPFWKAIAIIFVLLLPNIIWQVANDFPFFNHMKALKANQLDHNSSGSFLFDQLKFIAGSFLLVVGAVAAFIFAEPMKKYRFAGAGIIVTLAILTLLKAKNYYAFGIYPALFAIGSVYIERLLKGRSKPIVITLLIASNIVTHVALAKLMLPVDSPETIRKESSFYEKMGMLRWEDGKNHHLPQDYADMLGWREMAEKAYEVYEMTPASERTKTLIFGDNYGHAGAVNYYNRNKAMPEAYSFNTDYIFWIPRMDTIQHIVLIGEEPDDEVKALFNETLALRSVMNENAREKGTGIYWLKNAREGFTEKFYHLRKRRIETHDIF